MKKIISLLLLGFMMPLGASAEVDTFMSISPLQSYLTNMSADLSEASQIEEDASVAPIIGTLALKGVAGEGQKNKYSLWYVGKDKVEKWSSKRIGGELLLNKPTQLQTGFYMVGYESGMMGIEIKEGETLEVNLEKIDITPKGHQYRVYMDFASEEQRSQLQVYLWMHSTNKHVSSYCRDASKKVQLEKFCRRALSEDFNVFSKIVEFNNNSEWLLLDKKSAWRNQGRVYIKHATSTKKKETFVSVLPGAYKVEFNR